MKFIDTHSHYIHHLFNKDREKLIDELLNSDVEYIIQISPKPQVSNTKYCKHGE